MDNLPSLSLGATPWSTPHRYTRVGGGGRRYSREDSLLSSLDEVPLMSDDEEQRRRRRGDGWLEEVEEEEDDEEDDKAWGTKWRRRLRNRTGLARWLCEGGLQQTVYE